MEALGVKEAVRIRIMVRTGTRVTCSRFHEIIVKKTKNRKQKILSRAPFLLCKPLLGRHFVFGEFMFKFRVKQSLFERLDIVHI